MTTRTARSECVPASAGRLPDVSEGLGARGWRRLIPHAGAGLLFCALSVLMTWPVSHGLRHHLISWGDPVFQAWTMAWDVHAWTTAPLHIFDANIFYPYRNTLAYSDTLFGQAALMLPILLLKSSYFILADNLSTLLAMALSAFAMYLLVVDITGSKLAGVVAGLGYAFAPLRMAHIEHLQLLSAEWLPLAVLTARRALRGRSWRWGAALGLCVVMQGLFGVYYLYFMAVLLILVVASYLIAMRSRAALIATGQVVVCCAVGAALLLPTLLPYQTVHNDLGAERGTTEVQKWSATWGDYLAVNPDNRFWGPKLAPQYHVDLERDLFPGAALLALGILGLFNRRFGWERWMLLTVTAVCVVLSFGPIWHIGSHEIPGLYRLPYELLPGFKAIRVPARLALLALVGLAGMAGLGVDLLLRALGRVRLQPPALLAGSLVLVLALSVVVLGEDATRIKPAAALPISLAEAQRPDYAWLEAHPQPTIELPMGNGIIASAWPNFWSIMHWNPVVNGYSGIAPPAYYVFRDRMNAFPTADTIRLLQGMGVRSVVYHSDPKVAPARDPVLSKISNFPELKQVLGGPDYVFTLAPDPWMWNLARAVPSGKPVDLPALPSDPATFGMLAAILQRSGHTVYGQGTLQYWHLPTAPTAVCYAVMPSGDASLPVRYQGASSVGTFGGLTLYGRASCGG